MKIYCLVVGPLRENCYVIVNENKEAIIIDPGDEANRIISFANQYKVVGILITHTHNDHIGALKEIESYYQLKANQPIANFQYETIANPGHTMDSKSFYFPKEKVMFVGDFVFFHAVGRTDIGGDANLMKRSLQNLLTQIPEDTVLCPGHGRYTTLKREKNFYQSVMKELA